MSAKVIPVRQRSQYSCMAASLAMCLNALGYQTNEDETNKVLGAKPMQGAAWEQALAASQHYGCRATLVVPATLRQLKAWTDASTPVMIAWNPEGREWSHASVVFDVEEREDGLWVHVADPNIPNPDKTTRVLHEDDFYKKWYEKWPNYLVRRPAMAVEREVTPEGRQVVASSVPTPLSITTPREWIKAEKLIFENSEYEARNPEDKILQAAWYTGYSYAMSGDKDRYYFQMGRSIMSVAQKFDLLRDAGREWKEGYASGTESSFKTAGKKPQPVQEKKDDSNTVRTKLPKQRDILIEQMITHPGGTGRHHNRERDVAEGRSRKPKHRRDVRDMEARVAERYLGETK